MISLYQDIMISLCDMKVNTFSDCTLPFYKINLTILRIKLSYLLVLPGLRID